MERESNNQGRSRLEVERELLLRDVREIQQLVASLPDRDIRTPETIIDYDESGLPA